VKTKTKLEDPNFLSKAVAGSVRLLSLPQDENQFEGMKIWYSWDNSSGNADGTEHRNTEHLQDSLQKWQKRWDRFVRAQWDYFEGNGAE
jgi:hypothetical protein